MNIDEFKELVVRVDEMRLAELKLAESKLDAVRALCDRTPDVPEKSASEYEASDYVRLGGALKAEEVRAVIDGDAEAVRSILDGGDT